MELPLTVAVAVCTTAVPPAVGLDPLPVCEALDGVVWVTVLELPQAARPRTAIRPRAVAEMRA